MTCIIHGVGKIKIEEDVIENVVKFKIFGSYITPEGDSEIEIKIRLRIARKAITDHVELLKSKDLSLKVKVKLAKSLVGLQHRLSIALHG